MGLEYIQNNQIEIDEEIKWSLMYGDTVPDSFIGKKAKITFYYFKTPFQTINQEAIVISVIKKKTQHREGAQIITFVLDNGRNIELNFDTIDYYGEGIEKDEDGAFPMADVIIEN